MKTTAIIVFLVVLAASIIAFVLLPTDRTAPGDDEPGDRFILNGGNFTLNGKPFRPRIISLDGDRENPKAGDLIHVDRHLLTLGEGEKFDFITTESQAGRVFLKDENGEGKRVVSVRVSWTFDDDTKVVRNPLAKLSAAEVKGLWGLVLDEWPAGIEKKLAEIDPRRTCVTVTENTAQGNSKSFPELPAELRYLRLDESSSMGIKDYGSLARFTELRVLIMRILTKSKLDLRAISKNRRLRYLGLSGCDITNQDALEALTELRELDMSWCEELKSIAFVRGMKHLRFLELSRSGVSDLSALGGLPELQRVYANMTPVSLLPKQRLPALGELHIMSAPVSAQAVDAFREAHPESTVTHGWTDAFVQAVKNVTRIRVRSGGTCHRDPAREKTLFEIKTAEEIKEFVANVRVDESRSGFHCMCCGEPTIEFHEDKKIVVSFGFHHGKSLRWPGGWPADAALVEASADYIVKWLADHGVKGPEQERVKGKKSESALRRRWDRWLAVIPDEVAAGLRKAKSTADALNAFEGGIKDGSARARLYLRMWGLDEASWYRYNGLDEMIKSGLENRVSEEDMAAALKLILGEKDRDGIRGVARWMFGEYKDGKLKPKPLASVMPEIANAGLASPRRHNRKRTITVLRLIGTREAVAALRECLAGKAELRELPRAQQIEPDGMVSFSPRDGEVEDACSDRAHAAWCLAQLGDTRSFAAIGALHKEAGGEDRKVLDKAMDLLKTAGKKDE